MHNETERYRDTTHGLYYTGKCQNMCTKLACLRRNLIAAGPKPMLDAEAIYGLIRKRTEYGNLRN